MAVIEVVCVGFALQITRKSRVICTNNPTRSELRDRKMAKNLNHADRYDQANLEAASIIAADPTKYPAGSLAAIWADAITSKAAEVKDQDVGRLFRQRNAA